MDRGGFSLTTTSSQLPDSLGNLCSPAQALQPSVSIPRFLGSCPNNNRRFPYYSRDCILGVKLDGLLVAFDGLVVVPQLRIGTSHIVPSRCKLRVKFDGFPVTLKISNSSYSLIRHAPTKNLLPSGMRRLFVNDSFWHFLDISMTSSHTNVLQARRIRAIRWESHPCIHQRKSTAQKSDAFDYAALFCL